MINKSKKLSTPATQLLIWIFPLLVIFLTIRTPNDTDMWWHLRSGYEMVQRGSILTTDIFSFTRSGTSWTNVFWLSDIIIFGIYKIGGFYALSFSAAILVSLCMLIVYKQNSAPIPIAIVLILIAAFGLSPFSGVRPQLFSFILLAILDLELTNIKRSRVVRPWLFIFIFILWANMHGGYIWGLLLLIAFIAGQIVINLLRMDGSFSWGEIGNISKWGFLAALSTAINPNGIAAWQLPFYTIQVSISKINEWASPDFHRLDLQPILWLIFLFLIGVSFSKTKPGWDSLFKFIGLAFMGFFSQRSIAPFLIVGAPITAKFIGEAWSEQSMVFQYNQKKDYIRKSITQYSKIYKIGNFLIISFLILLIIGRIFSVSTTVKVFSEFPTKAVAWIKENQPDGKMFNSYNWGGYLTWELREYPVFVDGRADVYGSEILSEWWQIVDGTDKGIKLMDEWGINLILLEPGWPIIQKLPGLGWKLLYSDSLAVVWGR